MKFIIVVASLLVVTMAQRPTYAGSRPKGVPELHSRFQDTENTDSNLANRVGENTPEIDPNLPTDARGDQELVNRVNTWPREHQPFWLINAQHLEQHRHPQNNEQILASRNVESRSNFGDTIPAKPDLPKSSFVRSRFNK